MKLAQRALTLALATVNGNLQQLVVGGRDTSIPWKVSSMLEADQTWAALFAHGVLTLQDRHLIEMSYLFLLDSSPDLR